jgi:hypothetical protein
VSSFSNPLVLSHAAEAVGDLRVEDHGGSHGYEDDVAVGANPPAHAVPVGAERVAGADEDGVPDARTDDA